MFSPPQRGGKYTAVLPQGFVRGTFPAVNGMRDRREEWRSWPANVLTFMNLGAGALVCWWAASEFDLGWAPAEWLDSLGWMKAWMDVTGSSERRVAGILWLLAVWGFGQLCDLLDGAVARAMGADGAQGAMLDSMADLVSAGLAPAFIGMALMMEWRVAGGLPDGLEWTPILALLVMLAGAWRLARYARGSGIPEDRRFDFAGIPAPMAALYWGVVLWVWAAEGAASLDWTVWLGAVGVTLLPLGMVSRWPQFGFKTWGQDRGLDRTRIGWLMGTASLVIVYGAVGGALALISYPLTAALFIRLRPST